MNLFQGNIFIFPFFLLLFYSPINGGGGHGPLVYLRFSSNSGAAKICERGQSEGAKQPSEGRGVPPSHGFREIFQNLCMKLAFSCTLDTIIRDSLCTGINQFPTLFLFFILFLMNLFQGNIFLFLFPFPFFSPSNS